MTTATQPQKPARAFLAHEPGFGYMIGIGVMAAGFTSVDAITNMMIPITCKYFTDSAVLISFLVALNRLCGFTVGPFVAWKGDHITTRFGSRRPFLMLGLPLTLVPMLFIGSMPMWIEGAARTATWALALLIVFNFLMQFFQDFNWGGMDPLYADTFEHEQLGRAMAVRNYANQIVSLFMTYVAIRILAPKSEFLPYVASAGWLLLSMFVLVFFIRERPRNAAAPKEFYNPLTHMGMVFKSPDYLKLTLMGICWLSTMAVFVSLLSLFATRTLGLSMKEYGNVMTIEVVVAFLLAMPLGYVVDRVGPKWVIFCGFVCFVASSAMMAFVVDSYATFVGAIVLRSFALVLTGLPMASMLFQYVSPSERGAVYGSISFYRSSAAFLSTWLVGFVVQMTIPRDAVPFVALDMNRPQEIAQKVLADDAFAAALRQNLPPEVVELARANEYEAADKEAQADLNAAVAAALNGVLEREQAPLAKSLEVVPQASANARKLMVEDRTPEQTRILNRILMEDYFGKALGKSVNYRVSYIICLILTLIATLTTATMRKGQFGRTLREVDGGR